MENKVGIVISIISIFISFIIVISSKDTKECNCPLCKMKEDKTNMSKLIKVDVKGAVKEPKVYILEEDATVEDAITMAGGVRD